jgi:hypothetical protein
MNLMDADDTRDIFYHHVAGFKVSIFECVEYYADENITGTQRQSFIDSALLELRTIIASAKEEGKAEGEDKPTNHQQ